ncbi:MAG: hypothetical protein BGO49_26255 [Planctomycetales bacterium 71-10]|nr:MAG: hypothetical protein BGO49_26255 [Planctomycetales bacterium 71-10]
MRRLGFPTWSASGRPRVRPIGPHLVASAAGRAAGRLLIALLVLRLVNAPLPTVDFHEIVPRGRAGCSSALQHHLLQRHASDAPSTAKVVHLHWGWSLDSEPDRDAGGVAVHADVPGPYDSARDFEESWVSAAAPEPASPITVTNLDASSAFAKAIVPAAAACGSPPGGAGVSFPPRMPTSRLQRWNC